MTLSVIVRYRNGDSDTAIKAARINGPLLLEAGATSIQMSRIMSGTHTGQIVVITKYTDWEGYGAAMKKLAGNAAYLDGIKMLAAAGLSAEDRTFLVDIPY